MGKSKKTLIFASAVLTLALLVGCAPSTVRIDGVENPDEMSKTNDTVNEVDALLDADQWVDVLEDADYRGYNFTIATTRENVFLIDDGASSVVDDAKALRNEMAEKKYNVKIVEKLYEAENILPEQSIAALVDTSIADIVCAPAEQLAVLADHGLLLNLYSVPYLNMSAKYVSEKLVKQYTAKNTAYMMFDDLIPYQTNLWAVFYNVDMVKKFGLEDPYERVREGTWTWDMMLQMAKKVASESENGTRYYGLSSYYNGKKDLDLAYAMLGSMGEKYFADTYRTDMTLSLDCDVANKAVNMFLDVIGSDMHYNGDGNDAITEFSEGRLLFYVYETSLAAALANSKSDWSVVPLPKYSAEQEGYYSWLDLSAMAIGVFNTNTDTPRAGRILNCLCAASYGHIREATDTAYLNYYLRNNRSAVMLTKYVYGNPFIDLTYLYGNGMEDLRMLTIEKFNKAIFSGDDLDEGLYDSENKSLAESFMNEKFK